MGARRTRRAGALLVAEILTRYPHPLAIHNVQFDIPTALRSLDLEPLTFTERVHESTLVDTMILARLRYPDERRAGLKEISSKLFGAGATVAEQTLKLAFKHLPGSVAEKRAQVDAAHPTYWGYAAADAVLTARLHEHLSEPPDEQLLLREMRVAMICMRAGLRGWAVDPEAAGELDIKLAADEEQLAQALRRKGIADTTTTAGRAAIVAALEREGVTDLNPSRLSRVVLEPLAIAGSTIAADVLRLRTSAKLRVLYAALLVSAGERDGRLHAFPLTSAPSPAACRSRTCRCKPSRRASCHCRARTAPSAPRYGARSSPTSATSPAASTSIRWNSGSRPCSPTTPA